MYTRYSHLSNEEFRKIIDTIDLKPLSIDDLQELCAECIRRLEELFNERD